MTAPEPSGRAALAYGALGLPLAFAALPLYVHVPHLYADGLGLPLATVGAVLLAVRIADAVTDPLIGWASDRFGARRTLIVAALPLLGVGMPALLAPPDGAGAAWLAALLVVVSLGYSMASIAHGAWGAEAAPTPGSRTRLVALREGFGLAGVLLASALPGLLAGGAGVADGLARLGWIFVPLLLACAGWTLLGGPAAAGRRTGGQAAAPGMALAPRRAAGNRASAGVEGPSASIDGRIAHVEDPSSHVDDASSHVDDASARIGRLLGVFALNGIAAAIPSATVLFFVSDVLQAPEQAGAFLAAYFVAAAASLPAWVALSARIGKVRTWLAGMLGACVAFAGAAALGPGDVAAFGAICLLSGLALGADLALPASLLADLLARHRAGPAVGGAGAGFGWWAFVTKANLALAGGLGLPLLAWLGYAPGERDDQALRALAIVYAGVPVALKLGAAALLWRWRGTLEPPTPFHGRTT